VELFKNVQKFHVSEQIFGPEEVLSMIRKIDPRWSKPHVGSMSLHYVFELREIIKTCTICLDLPARNLVGGSC
jgi:hypothetical protein